MSKLPFALQLYTVRDHLSHDPERTLERVKAIGYDYVEIAGTGGRTPQQFKRILDANELTPVSSHTGLDEVAKDVKAALDLAELFGVNYLVFSGHSPDKPGWLDLARRADEVGAKLREAGVSLCYHNHAHEFQTFDGVTGYDLLMSHTDPRHLGAEIDVYWAQYGNVNPAALIDQYSDRCPLLHVKDMTATEPRTFAEVGQGILDMPAIFQAGKRAGTQWYIVEQDTCAGDPLDSAHISAEYMAKQTI